MAGPWACQPGLTDRLLIWVLEPLLGTAEGDAERSLEARETSSFGLEDLRLAERVSKKTENEKNGALKSERAATRAAQIQFAVGSLP